MPYHIESVNGAYRVKNVETGRVAAKHTTKAKAERQERLLRGVEHGFKPTGKPKKDPPGDFATASGRVVNDGHRKAAAGDFHHETVIVGNPHLVEYYYDNLRRM